MSVNRRWTTRVGNATLWTTLLISLWSSSLPAQNQPAAILPPADAAPVLRVNAGGPLSSVSALGFSADSQTLYAAGWDKLVHAWTRGPDGHFGYNAQAALRIPVGAGLQGAINAMAVSADGEWIAVAGRGFAEGIAGPRQVGWVLPAPAAPLKTRQDMGMIYVFRPGTREVKLLRGHAGVVTALAFVEGRPRETPALVSIADEQSDTEQRSIGVLRAWDVARAREFAQLNRAPTPDYSGWKPLPDRNDWQPTLAAWSTGPELQQIRVALSWGDNEVRVWNPPTNQVIRGDSRTYTLSVARLPWDPNWLMVGSYGRTDRFENDFGELGTWSIHALPQGSLASLDLRRDFSSVKTFGRLQLPRAMAFFAAQPNSARDKLAVVVEQRTGTDALAPVDYRLLVLEAAQKYRPLAEQTLWRTLGPSNPALAVSPDGQLVAVAGNERNEIHLSRTQDLLRSNGVALKPQLLASQGATFRFVAFARKGDSLGLVLNPRRPAAKNHSVRDLQPTDRLFDVGQREVTSRLEGWRIVAPAQGDWGLEEGNENPERPTLHVLQGGRRVATVSLQTDSGEVVLDVTDFALCPPSAHCPVPLVAAAVTLKSGEPRLMLFRGDTGEEIRRCTGHVGPIRCLSFSDDGRMLASAAEDKVVSVWSLVDLARDTLDKHGLIPGFVLEGRQNTLVVREAPAGEARAGDVLVGLQQGDVLRRFDTPREFYREILRRVPKDRVKLNLQRGGQPVAAELVVGQAVDERKPLFSLFLAQGARPELWSWIGWHPQGLFDAADQNSERLLGWHFNTGDPAAPARFAAAGEYRDVYYQRDLLQQLIEFQEPRALPVPAPRMSLQLRQRDGEALRRDYDDQVPVRSPNVELAVMIADLSSRHIASLQWQLDGGEFHPLTQTSETTWEAGLSEAAWSRKSDQLRVKLVTRELHPREFSATEFVRFQPPAPKLGTVKIPDMIREPSLPLRVEIPAPAEPAIVRLAVTHRDTEQEVGRWTIDKEKAFLLDETLNLQPGENRVALSIHNVGALAGFESFETTRIVQTVRFERPELPAITMETVEALPENQQPTVLEPSQTVYQTRIASVRIRGKITSLGKLRTATRELAGDMQSLNGFAADQLNELAITEEIVLKPGRQTLLLKAATADGTEEKRLELDYRPELPRIVSLDLEPDVLRKLPRGVAQGELLYEGYHAPKSQLRAVLAPLGAAEYDATVLVNNQPLPLENIQVNKDDPARHEVTAAVALRPGANQIIVRLTNRWDSPPESREIRCEFRRPPQIASLDVPEQLASNRLELRCEARCPADLPLTAATVLVNGIALPSEQIEFQQVEQDPQRWTIHARAVTLTAGGNTIRVTAANRDGESLEPATREVRFDKPTPQPPTVLLNAPRETSQPQVRVEYEVNSETSLRGIRVLRNGSPLDAIPQPEPEARAITGSVLVALDAGYVNEIQVIAENEGGQGRAVTRISRTDPPASITIVRLEGQTPVPREGRQVFVKPVPTATATLEGKIVLHDPRVWPLGEQRTVKLWANGFLRAVGKLQRDPQRPDEATFRLAVVLNRPRRNLLRLELPGSQVEDGSPREFEADCLQPEQGQQLHLLIVGMDVQNPAKLKQRALEALAAETHEGKYSSAAFSRIQIEPPLIAPDSGELNWAIARLHSQFRNQMLADNSVPNRVLMIYYQGRELVARDGEFYLETADNRPLREDRSKISSSRLRKLLGDTYGAHLIFLDVQQELASDRDLPAQQRIDPYLGIVRRIWTGMEPPGEDAQLLSSLKQVIPNSELLRDLKQRLSELLQDSFDPAIPPALEDLRIGAKGG